MQEIFHPAQYRHAVWMLDNQIDSPGELIALWALFPDQIKVCPSIEVSSPWSKGLQINEHKD